MRHKFILLMGSLLLAISLMPISSTSQRAYAEGPQSLSSLHILVWPEYDDPRVLVQYEGQLAAKDGFPRDMSFFMPSSAEIYASAYAGDDGNFINTEKPQVQAASDGFSLVTLKLPAAGFHLEYYYNPLPATPDKTMDFVYKAAQPADKVRLEIQQPLKAENFTTVPPAGTQTTGYHDFKNYIFDYSGITVNQVLTVKVSYTKTSPEPSVSSVSQAAQAAASQPNSAVTSDALIPIGVGAAMLAVGALAFLAWWSRREPTSRVTNASAGRKHGRNRGRGSEMFCPQCGQPLQSDDNFCARCGTKKRG
jgi:zinc ribbon protein